MSNNQPDIIPVTDKTYRLDEYYTYFYRHDGIDYRINVFEGFTYDGASVPRFTWSLTGLLPDGLLRAAALLHDWIYEHKGKLPNGSHVYRAPNGKWLNVEGAWSRRDADKLFARVLREFGVSKFKRRIAYLAVRAFGGFDWRD